MITNGKPITPIQTTALIAGYGLCTQGYGVWKLRHTLNWRTVAPFIFGGTIGVPLGTMLLTYVNPVYLRGGVGILLVVLVRWVNRTSSRSSGSNAGNRSAHSTATATSSLR